MANLRKTFDIIMRKYGYDIFLQRKDFKIAAVGPHQIRDNGGFQNQLERHTVRSRYPVNSGMSNVVDEKPEGMAHNVDMIYYFRHDALPKEGDRIYEQDERFKDRPFLPGLATYIVSFSMPMRGKGGRTEYWVVGAKREEPN